MFLIRVTCRRMYCWLRTLRSASAGQDLVEYALVAGLIVTVGATLMPAAAAQITIVMSKVQSVIVSSGNESSGNH